jgi:deazaflavin-dependent oxidoreductase (nitroreductase family)
MNHALTRQAPANTGRQGVARAPRFVRIIDPIARRVMRLGAPLGPNTIITIRGRTSGAPRDAAVAILHLGERRWVIGSFGETHWVRNLRAAGEAEMTLHGKKVRITARELSRPEAEAFFAETLSGYVRSLPAPGRLFARLFLKQGSLDMLADPVRAAAERPVFELTLPEEPAR